MINLAERDGELYYIEGFIAREEACALHQRLFEELAWREEEIAIGAQRVKVPRLVCWYGDPQAVYSYSGVVHPPLPWTPTLQRLKERLENYTRHSFNSVLGNLYRSGGDSMGWHADKEKELGPNPFIASLSLGEERLFKIRHNKTKKTLAIPLTDGSLLLMGGSLQHHWRHCVPKSRREKRARINLTFRRIYPA